MKAMGHLFLAVSALLLGTIGAARADTILEQLSPTPTAYVFGPDFNVVASAGPSADVSGLLSLASGTVDGSTGYAIGCDAGSYAASAGTIVLVSRGTCEFDLKIGLAQDAGALGILIINNVAGANAIAGGGDLLPADAVPGYIISNPLGLALAGLVADGQQILMRIAYGPNATALVPEAQTWAMMILGFAALAFARQGRRARARA